MITRWIRPFRGLLRFGSTLQMWDVQESIAGDHITARKHYETACRLAPGDPYYKETLDRADAWIAALEGAVGPEAVAKLEGTASFEILAIYPAGGAEAAVRCGS
jgi:hypothetical protein